LARGHVDETPAVHETGPSTSAVRFEPSLSTETAGSMGHASLLKQQIRDLVLRRKSLVAEEPDTVTAGRSDGGHGECPLRGDDE